jgi:hypothetical protein
VGIHKLTTILCALIVALHVDARPISYSGGSTLMYKSDNMQDSLYAHYSPTYKYSIGIEKVEDNLFDEDQAHFRFVYLLNRKNTKLSQRNLYFQSGISLNNNNSSFYGVHGDWETRRLFSGFGYKVMQNNITEDYSDQYLQVGVAPYLGDYGDLHTWIMIKTKKNSLTKNRSTYPVLKFFKGNALVELGYNDKTEWDLHLVYRF